MHKAICSSVDGAALTFCPLLQEGIVAMATWDALQGLHQGFRA